MQSIVKDDISAVITKHSLVPDQDRMSALIKLIDDYLPWSSQLLQRYMVDKKLCFSKDEAEDTKWAKVLSLACFIVILYELEEVRKGRGSESIVKNPRRRSSETLGSYSVTYLSDQATNEFFGLIEKSPITYFINIALQPCPLTMPIMWVPPCSNAPQQKPNKSCT